MPIIDYKERDKKIKLFEDELHSLQNEEVNKSYEIHFYGPPDRRIPVFLFKTETNTSRGEREDAYGIFTKYFPDPFGKIGSM